MTPSAAPAKLRPQSTAPMHAARHALRPHAALAAWSSRHSLSALSIAGAALALTAAGCVTINIYFPAAAAEKAADRIIEEVYQLRKDAVPAKPAEAK